MKHALLVSYAAILLLLNSCTPAREKDLARIKASEDSLRADTSKVFNKTLADKNVKLYLDFADKYPSDTAAPVMLFRAGQLSGSLHRPSETIDIYKRILEKYPSFEKDTICLFMMGFTYETQLKDIEKARKAYSDFLEKYPGHHLARDVKFSLDNLGKSDEEIIRMFEEKNKTEAKN